MQWGGQEQFVINPEMAISHAQVQKRSVGQLNSHVASCAAWWTAALAEHRKPPKNTRTMSEWQTVPALLHKARMWRVRASSSCIRAHSKKGQVRLNCGLVPVILWAGTFHREQQQLGADQSTGTLLLWEWGETAIAGEAETWVHKYRDYLSALFSLLLQFVKSCFTILCIGGAYNTMAHVSDFGWHVFLESVIFCRAKKMELLFIC